MRSGRTLAIIPARGGSKALPRKNILPLCGKPLVAWTIEQGAASKRLTRCIVSSDSDEIIRVAKDWGGDVPFVRPAEYARDDSPTSEAILHALDTLKARGETYDFIVELEPTSPLRRPGDIDDALATFLARDCDTLVTVGEVHMEHPGIVKRIEGDFLRPYIPGTTLAYQRQQLDGAYFPYGVIYIATVDYYRRARSFYGERTAFHFIERWQNYEVDDEDDLAVCEVMMGKHMLPRTGGA